MFSSLWDYKMEVAVILIAFDRGTETDYSSAAQHVTFYPIREKNLAQCSLNAHTSYGFSYFSLNQGLC